MVRNCHCQNVAYSDSLSNALIFVCLLHLNSPQLSFLRCIFKKSPGQVCYCFLFQTCKLKQAWIKNNSNNEPLSAVWNVSLGSWFSSISFSWSSSSSSSLQKCIYFYFAEKKLDFTSQTHNGGLAT